MYLLKENWYKGVIIVFSLYLYPPIPFLVLNKNEWVTYREGFHKRFLISETSFLFYMSLKNLYNNYSAVYYFSQI